LKRCYDQQNQTKLGHSKPLESVILTELSAQSYVVPLFIWNKTPGPNDRLIRLELRDMLLFTGIPVVLKFLKFQSCSEIVLNFNVVLKFWSVCEHVLKFALAVVWRMTISLVTLFSHFL